MGVLFILMLILIVPQWAGYYLAKKKNNARYRWWAFWGMMIIWYLFIFIGYARDLAYYQARQYSCAMWTIMWWGLCFAGLIMPILQAGFSIKELIVAGRRPIKEG